MKLAMVEVFILKKSTKISNHRVVLFASKKTSLPAHHAYISFLSIPSIKKKKAFHETFVLKNYFT